MTTLEEIRRPVSKEMKSFQKSFRDSVHSDVRLLNIVTSYILRNKGKQIRPLLVFLTAKMVREITPSTYTAATLIELLHTATLIHDDVVDVSYQRRNKFSVNAIWKSKIAVLMGDYFLARGLLHSVRNNDHVLLDIVSDAVKEMSEGELLQLQKSRSLNINTETYYDVIRKKTATLLASCTASGAKSAGAGQDEIDRMYEMGINLGMAFQIKDDLLDYQSSRVIGKPAGNDIKEKKFTLPLIYSLNQSDPAEKRSIIRMIRNGRLQRDRIEYIMDFVKRHGGLIYAEEKMNEFKDHALSMLDSYSESEARNSLADLIRFITERKK
jgi:octaprenyl-diphosphate synthase